jgi:D-3-phosphoglycerate dehydrogenase
MGKIVEDGIRILADKATIEINPFDRVLEKAELKQYLKDVEGTVLGGDQCDREVINAAKRLKVIGRHGVGYDNVDLEAATENGIVVTYTPDVNTNAVAEHTMALFLSLVRKIPFADASMRAFRWEGLKFVGNELAQKKLGIIGLGRIGCEVAKRASAFGMKVVCFDKYQSPEVAKKLGVVDVAFHQLLAESDIISIHTALTEETRGMLGSHEIDLMKRSAYLVNTARGAIVDGKALREALQRKRIAGAALDVFDKEPLERSDPLLKLENVILTPHIGAYTMEAIRKMDVMVAEDVGRALEGKIPQHVANTEVLSLDNIRLKT